MPYGCLYSVNQQAVNIVFQQQSISGGLSLTTKSALWYHPSSPFSTDIPRRKSTPSHKTQPQNTNTASFSILWPLFTQLPLITQSTFAFKTGAVCMYMRVACMQGYRQEKGEQQGYCDCLCSYKYNVFLCRRSGSQTGELRRQMNPKTNIFPCLLSLQHFSPCP